MCVCVCVCVAGGDYWNKLLFSNEYMLGMRKQLGDVVLFRISRTPVTHQAYVMYTSDTLNAEHTSDVYKPF